MVYQAEPNGGKIIKGILFDMDGVLIDSEASITRAAMEILKENYSLTVRAEDFTEFTGMGEDRYIGGVAEKYGVKYVPEMKRLAYKRYSEFLPAEIGTFPNVLPTVKALKRLRFKMAICTSSDQEKLSVSMRVAGLTDGMFDFIISGDRVKRKKPFPDIYLCGAESLGLPTERCAVVEDAVTGIKAAKTAGCYAVGITTSFTERELFSAGADRVIADIGELLKPDGTVI